MSQIIDNKLTKIMDFEFQFRKPYEDIEDLMSIVNKKISKKDSCVICYDTRSRVLKIKVYRCRQSFSSLVIAAVVKQIPKDVGKLLTIANMVDSNNGLIQFSIKETESIKNVISGPILHVDLYEPKDTAHAKLLKQRLETI